jgi:hypothetical protein
MWMLIALVSGAASLVGHRVFGIRRRTRSRLSSRSPPTRS